MGRRPWSDRCTVEECLDISMSWLKAHGFLAGYKWVGIQRKNASGEITNSIGIRASVSESTRGLYVRFRSVFSDRISGEKEQLDYEVELDRTPCTFGGVTYWFLCPLMVNGKPCRRRVGKLYLPPGAKYLGCRHCYNLTYRSRQRHNKTMDPYRRLGDKELLLLMDQGDVRALRVLFKRMEGL